MDQLTWLLLIESYGSPPLPAKLWCLKLKDEKCHNPSSKIKCHIVSGLACRARNFITTYLSIRFQCSTFRWKTSLSVLTVRYHRIPSVTFKTLLFHGFLRKLRLFSFFNGFLIFSNRLTRWLFNEKRRIPSHRTESSLHCSLRQGWKKAKYNV